MVNEEILTVLKNSVNNGDSIQSAIQIMINSGYDPREVHEASHFIAGISQNLQATPQENQITQRQRAAMTPQQRFSNQQPQKPIQQQNPPQQPTPQQTQRPMQPQPTQPIPTQPIPTPQKTLGQPLVVQPLGKSPKKSYLKEIILVFILLLLIGVLTITIIFRDAILGWFS